MGRRNKKQTNVIGQPLATAPDLLHPRDIVFTGTARGAPFREELPFVVVIPFLNRGRAEWREKALNLVIDQLLLSHTRVVLSVQGKSPRAAEGRLLVLENDDLGDDFHKSTLINRGIGFALKRWEDWEWMWQSDADILYPVSSVLDVLLDPERPNACNVIVPWKDWARLTQGQTTLVCDFPHGPRIFEQVSPRLINHGAGAGGLMLRREMLEDGFRWDDKFVNWGWEDADAAKRAGMWEKSAYRGFFRGKESALHLWHENDRVVQVENGEHYFQGSIPEGNLSGVLLEAKTKYLLVALGRSGGNLLGRAMNLHPDVHCANNEPFVHDCPEPAIEATNMAIRRWTLLGPLASPKPVTGMRLQYSHVNPENFKFSCEDYINWAHAQEFQLVHLIRDNTVEIALSNALARRSGKWINHKYPAEPVYLPPDEFKFYWDWIRQQHRKWIPKLQKMGALDVIYENLCEDWDNEMNRVFDFLGVPPQIVEQPIQKQTKRPHLEYFSNWKEISKIIKEDKQHHG